MRRILLEMAPSPDETPTILERAPSPSAPYLPDEEEEEGGDSEKDSAPEENESGSSKLKSHKVSPVVVG